MDIKKNNILVRVPATRIWEEGLKASLDKYRRTLLPIGKIG